MKSSLTISIIGEDSDTLLRFSISAVFVSSHNMRYYYLRALLVILSFKLLLVQISPGAI